MHHAAVNRRFARLLLLSLALHGSLFALMRWPGKPVAVTLPPLLASLRLIHVSESGGPQVPAPPALPSQARPLPPREIPAVSRARAAAVPTTQQPEMLAMPRSDNATTTSTLPPAAMAAQPNVRSDAGASAAVAASAPVNNPPATEVSPARSTGDPLAAYRQRLSEIFARQQIYPRIAALRGWEGEVRLRLKVARKGNLLGVVLDRSSGFDVLDQHALAMLASLGNLPPLPEALDSNEIQVVVPINYKLNKTT